MRVCDDCGKWMRQGFVIDAGVKYFCEDCHPKHYTPEQWEEMYGDGDTENYFTSWEDDGECEGCGITLDASDNERAPCAYGGDEHGEGYFYCPFCVPLK